MISFVGCLCLLLLLGGCATTSGRNFETSDVKAIEKGKTTKNQIQTTFGKPQYVMQSTQGETWMYSYGGLGGVATPFWIFGMKPSQKSLSVVFDDKDVVKDYNWSAYETQDRHFP